MYPIGFVDESYHIDIHQQIYMMFSDFGMPNFPIEHERRIDELAKKQAVEILREVELVRLDESQMIVTSWFRFMELSLEAPGEGTRTRQTVVQELMSDRQHWLSLVESALSEGRNTYVEGRLAEYEARIARREEAQVDWAAELKPAMEHWLARMQARLDLSHNSSDFTLPVATKAKIDDLKRSLREVAAAFDDLLSSIVRALHTLNAFIVGQF